MGLARKPFQGVLNILRFNWHFYLLGMVLPILLCFGLYLFTTLSIQVLFILLFLSLTPLLMSLVVSFWVYDCSSLYTLPWTKNLVPAKAQRILVVNAGFDECASIIAQRFPKSELKMCDFYDEKKHTEISIKRARKMYPPSPETIAVRTSKLPFNDEQFDLIVVMFAAHEIRDEEERALFFNEMRRVLSSDGSVVITEHLRNSWNFIAYTIGFLHFYSAKTWKKTFVASKLKIHSIEKITPFVKTYILQKT